MNTKFQIQIKIVNYNTGSHTVTKEISLNDLIKFSNLATIINENSNRKTWNWFGEILPTIWDGKRYVLDTYLICKYMEENFNYKVEDVNLIKEFFLRFTPHGADGIEWVKFFKVEEITDSI